MWRTLGACRRCLARRRLPVSRVAGDDVCEDDPAWTANFTLADVQRALVRVGFDGERLEDVRVDGPEFRLAA